MKTGYLCFVSNSVCTLLKHRSVTVINPVRRITNMNKNNSEKYHAFTIFVEGNIGSGKTSFLNHFSKYDALILAEPVEAWRNIHGYNFLDLMYKDSLKWGLAFQTIVQKTMLDLHVRKTHHSVKMMERSIHSARYCFVENLHRTNKLSSPDYTVLDEWYQWITKNLDVRGDLVVYLRTDPEVVHQRIKSRARPEEAEVPLEYLQQLHRIHEDWLFNKTAFSCPAPVVVVDANKDLPNMLEEYKKCELQIASHGYRMEIISPVKATNSPSTTHEHAATRDTKVNKVLA